MRSLVAAATLVLVLSGSAGAVPFVRRRPPVPIDAATFAQLVEATKAEAFPDGKLAQIRNVAAGRRYLFTGPQIVTLLELFTFWYDRVEALRLTSPSDAQNAAAVLRYFEPAPGLARSEARRILGL